MFDILYFRLSSIIVFSKFRLSRNELFSLVVICFTFFLFSLIRFLCVLHAREREGKNGKQKRKNVYKYVIIYIPWVKLTVGIWVFLLLLLLATVRLFFIYFHCRRCRYCYYIVAVIIFCFNSLQHVNIQKKIVFVVGS